MRRSVSVSLVLSLGLLFDGACTSTWGNSTQDAPPARNPAGAVLANVSVQALSDECPAGGVDIELGVDANADGELSGDEVNRVVTVCNGSSGAQALVEVAQIEAGDVCPAGGLRVRTGLDRNADDSLQEDEILRSETLCDGAVGTNGLMSLLRISEVEPSDECALGGIEISTGLDADGNGVLSDGETEQSTLICQPADGKTTLVVVDDVVGEACDAFGHGGQRMRSGLDDGDGDGVAHDGELHEDEVDSTTFVCNGATASTSPPCDTFEGSIRVRNRADLADLAGCREVTGDVEIRARGLAELSGLEHLETVGGSLVLYDLDRVTDLSPLANLREVGANFHIASVPNLERFELPSLESVGRLEARVLAAPVHLPLLRNVGEGVEISVVPSQAQPTVEIRLPSLEVAEQLRLAGGGTDDGYEASSGADAGPSGGTSQDAGGSANQASMPAVPGSIVLPLLREVGTLSFEGLRGFVNLTLPQLERVDQLQLHSNLELEGIEAPLLASVGTLWAYYNPRYPDCDLESLAYRHGGVVEELWQNGGGERDLDRDGVCPPNDACPLDPGNDADQDGICGNEDNCPLVANADQTDTDADGRGDACDVCPATPTDVLAVAVGNGAHGPVNTAAGASGTALAVDDGSLALEADGTVYFVEAYDVYEDGDHRPRSSLYSADRRGVIRRLAGGGPRSLAYWLGQLANTNDDTSQSVAARGIQFDVPIRQIHAEGDGSLVLIVENAWYTDPAETVVLRLTAEGQLEALAGRLGCYPRRIHETVDAREACFHAAQADVAPNGDVWLLDDRHCALYRLTPDGDIQPETGAAFGAYNFGSECGHPVGYPHEDASESGASAPANDVLLAEPRGLSVAADGSVYFVERNQLRRLVDGQIHTVHHNVYDLVRVWGSDTALVREAWYWDPYGGGDDPNWVTLDLRTGTRALRLGRPGGTASDEIREGANPRRISAYEFHRPATNDAGVLAVAGWNRIWRIDPEGTDADNDQVCDFVDNCPTLANANQADSDGDQLGDVCDPCPTASDNDLDGDGRCEAVDPCPFDPNNDSDQDGLCGNEDNCPDLANAAQADRDQDGLGDACDSCPDDAANDADGDGVCGDVDPCPRDAADDMDQDGICGEIDNCPTLYNTNQQDRDGDGLGDACDTCPLNPNNQIGSDGQCGVDCEEEGHHDGGYGECVPSELCSMGFVLAPDGSCGIACPDGRHDGGRGVCVAEDECAHGFYFDGERCAIEPQVAAGFRFSCALTPDGRVSCWGNREDAPHFGHAFGFYPYTSIDGGDRHACGLVSVGGGYDADVCWGEYPGGESTYGLHREISAGERHNCAIRPDDTIACWGDASNGRTAAPSGPFRAVSAGSNFSCAVRNDGEIICWGGEFGDAIGEINEEGPDGGTTGADAGSPQDPCAEYDFYGDGICDAFCPQPDPDCSGHHFLDAGYEDAGYEDAGNEEYWPVTDAGSAENSAGFDAGASGDGDGPSADPSRYPTGPFVALGAGNAHACGLREDGTVACWSAGATFFGQLNAPAGRFVQLTVGPFHNCALRSNGAAVCWGRSYYGEAQPPAVAFRHLAAGAFHTCGVMREGGVHCWGGNGYGEVGGREFARCIEGHHDDGEGTCVPLAQCREGYRDGGDGSCVPSDACAPGYVLSNDDLACVLSGENDSDAGWSWDDADSELPPHIDAGDVDFDAGPGGEVPVELDAGTGGEEPDLPDGGTGGGDPTELDAGLEDTQQHDVDVVDAGE